MFGDTEGHYTPRAEYLVVKEPRRYKTKGFVQGIVYVAKETSNGFDRKAINRDEEKTLRTIVEEAEEPIKIKFAKANAKVYDKERIKGSPLILVNYRDTVQTYHSRKRKKNESWIPLDPDAVLDRLKQAYPHLTPLSVGSQLFFTKWQAEQFDAIIMPWGEKTHYKFKRIVAPPQPHYSKPSLIDRKMGKRTKRDGKI